MGWITSPLPALTGDPSKLGLFSSRMAAAQLLQARGLWPEGQGLSPEMQDLPPRLSLSAGLTWIGLFI